MTTFQAIIIAIIEGLTEFLPISSTAHMRFANPLLGVTPSPFVDLYEVVIQLAAILAVVVIYWKKFFDFKKFGFYIKLIVAVIPALIGGLLLKKHIDGALSNLTFIACVMIGGGIILLFIERFFKTHTITKEENITYPSAFVVGCFQVLSIIFPGLSRSAATIIGGLSQKMSLKLAAEFSFFLAVPTMMAASAKSFLDVYKDNPEVLVSGNMGILIVGSIVSFIVSIIAIKFFIGMVQKFGFKGFGWYRIGMGIIILVLIANKVIA